MLIEVEQLVSPLCRVFPRPFTHGGICPPYGGTSAGAKALIGGTHEGGHRPYGDLTLIDYTIN